jgi:DNA polymerase-3 subunit beta
MKIRQAVALAAHVASRNSALPILQHVRIGGNHIVACDVEQQIEIPVTLPDGLDGAIFCVHAARLTRILKALPEEAELEFKVQGTRVFLAAGPTRYELNALGPEEFPRLDIPPEDAYSLTVPAAPFIKALRFCLPAMAVKDVRYYLNGMHMAIEHGRIALVATDGHRLHRARVALDGADGAHAAIFPAASIARILDIAGDHEEIELTLATSLAIVNAGGETLSTKLIDGQFPDADKVTPSARAATGSVARIAFAAAVKRVAQIFDADKFQGIRLDFDAQAITLSATNAGGECASERFDWSAADGKFKSLSLGAQWHYLVDALEAFADERVNLHLGKYNTDSLYLTDAGAGDREAVIMPANL